MTDYNAKTKKELLEIARARELEGRTSLDKEELVTALEALDASETVEAIEVVESEVETQENGYESVTGGIWEDEGGASVELEPDVSAEEPIAVKPDWLQDIEEYFRKRSIQD